MPKKNVTVYVLSERMPGEEWLIVAVYATYQTAETFANQLAAANGPSHQTRIDMHTVVPPSL